MGFGRGLQPPTSYRFAACLRSATEASLRFIVDLDDQVHALKTQLAERVAGRIAGRVAGHIPVVVVAVVVVVVVSCIMYHVSHDTDMLCENPGVVIVSQGSDPCDVSAPDFDNG